MEVANNLRKFGISEIPNGWQIKKLKKILREGRLGGNYQNAEANDGIPVIKMGNLDRGTIKIDKVQFLPKNDSYNDEDVLTKGDLLFNTRNTLELVGKVAIWNNELPFAVYNSNLMRMKFDQAWVESTWFMNRAFNSHYGLKQLRAIATGTTSVAAIYGRDLEGIKFLLPPLPEQRAIAKVLGSMDKAINVNNQLIAQKELRKKWLMQNLLSGKKRLKGFEEKWSPIKFQEIYSQIKEKAGDRKMLILSVTKDGIVSQADYFKKEIASKDTSPYLVMKKGDMVMSGLNFWMGSIDVLSEFEEGMVSPAYKVFEIINDNISPEFMRSFVRSKIMLRALIGSSVIGASIVRRNMDRETLNEWSFNLPSLEEQIAIAHFLQAADKELDLIRAKSDKLKEQKKGMMQVLLTGKKRLKID